MPDSFCSGIELCSIARKKLVQEKNLNQVDRHVCKFFMQEDVHEFLVKFVEHVLEQCKIQLESLWTTIGLSHVSFIEQDCK